MARKRIPLVQQMDDETFMKHMENRHAEALKMEFTIEPDRTERRLHSPKEWRAYHDTLHRIQIYGDYNDHYHEERINA